MINKLPKAWEKAALTGLIVGGLMLAGNAWAGAPNYANPYAFTTIAGTSGNPGYADGNNGAAQFFYPEGVAVGTNGNVYVVDDYENTVRQLAHVGTNWVVTTIAGTPYSVNSFQSAGSNDGTNGAAQFDEPIGIAADGAGNLYVTDTFYNTIRRLSPSGTNWVVTTIAGSAANPAGSTDGTNGTARFNQPYGVAADQSGNIYVADSLNNTIRQIVNVGTNWVVTTIAGLADPMNPTGASVDGTNQGAQFSQPYALTVDRTGNIFVVDGGSSVIREIVPQGTNWVVTTIAGTPNMYNTDDGTNGTIRFDSPYGIAIDASENLYIADTYNNSIRKLSPVGTNWVSTTLAGALNSASTPPLDGVGTNATFNSPWGIAVDASGKLYVGDTSNNDVRQGVLYVATLPNLTITASGANSVLVNWPGSVGTLQTNANLATGNWADYGGAVSNSGGTNTVTWTPAAGNMFFRLRN